MRRASIERRALALQQAFARAQCDRYWLTGNCFGAGEILTDPQAPASARLKAALAIIRGCH
jgi:hypothetical protein